MKQFTVKVNQNQTLYSVDYATKDEMEQVAKDIVDTYTAEYKVLKQCGKTELNNYNNRHRHI